MAFTKIVGAGIHTLSNVNTHNINSSGIITATQFVGIFTGTDGDFSGDVTIDGNLTVNGTTTTLDTNLINVDKIEVTTTGAIVGVAVTQNGSGDLVRLYDGSTQVVTVDDEGKVGVGTDSLTYPLEVWNSDPRISLVDTDLTNNRTVHLRNNQGSFVPTASHHAIFYTGGSERVRIKSDGKVGIGTNNPQALLDVSSNTPNFRITDLNSSAGAGNTSYTQLANINGNTYVYTRANENNGSYLIGGEGIGVFDEFIRITSSGKVGINTTTPQTILHITQEIDNKTDGIRLSRSNNAASYSQFIDASARFNIGYSNPGTADPDPQITLDQNGLVGIGTDNPLGKLHISGTGTNEIRIDTNSTGLSFHNHSEFIGFIGNDSGKFFINAGGTQDTLLLQTDGTEKLRITSAGNIGINSTSPANKLDVRLGAAWIYPDEDGTEAVALKLGKLKDYNQSLNDILVADNDQSSSPTYRVTSYIKRYIGNWYFDRSDPAGRINSFRITSAHSGGNLGNKFALRDLHGTADSIVLWSNGNSFVGVTTDGTTRNFGIGTGSPTAPLVVSSSENTLGILTSTDDGANIDLFDNDTQTRIRTVDGRLHLYADMGDSVSDSAIRFFVDGDNERVRITSDGNVGIGSQNPSKKLSIVSGNNLGISLINSTSFATAGIYLEGARNPGTGIVGDLHFYNRRNSSVVSNLRVNGNGEFNFNQSVGIGTDNVSPDRLRVHKDGLNQILQRWGGRQGPTAGQRFMELYTPATDNMNDYFKFQTGNAIKFRIDTINALCINSSGLVGIGTDAPSHELDIESSSPVIEMKDNDAGDSRFQIAQSGSQTYLDMDVGNLGSSSLRFRFAGQEKVRLTNTGRIGIGTDNPSQELSIWNSSPAIRLVDTDPYETGGYGQIAQSGNVLQIMADSGNVSSHGGVFFYAMNDNDSFNTYRISDNVHQWYISGQEKARLHSNGNLGIGTNSPASKLEVLGSIEKKDTNGLQNFFVSDGGFKFSQSPPNWSNMDYTSSPVLAWDYKSGPGDLFYIGSGGNTAIADQMAIVVSDGHGFKVGKSGYDGSDFDISSSNEFFRVSTGGKVTINCTAISAGGANPQLSVESETGSNIGIIQVHAGGGETNGDLSGIAFSHGTSGTVARPKAAIALNATGSYGKGHLCFYVDGANDDNTVSSGDEKLRITTGGTLEIERGSSADQAIDIKTTATTGASRIRFVESGTSQGELAYSHNNNQLELVARSGQSIVMFTNGTNERLRISTEGYVTKPQHPGFFAYMNGGNHTTNSGNVIPFNQTHFNNGGHFKTSGTNVNKFVCPVHGIYHFTGAMWMKNGSGDSHARWQIRKNNSIICQAGWHQSNTSLFYDHSAPAAVTVECNANDTVYCYADYTITYWRGGSAHPHSYFSGYLVG